MEVSRLFCRLKATPVRHLDRQTFFVAGGALPPQTPPRGGCRPPDPPLTRPTTRAGATNCHRVAKRQKRKIGTRFKKHKNV